MPRLQGQLGNRDLPVADGDAGDDTDRLTHVERARGQPFPGRLRRSISLGARRKIGGQECLGDDGVDLALIGIIGHARDRAGNDEILGQGIGAARVYQVDEPRDGRLVRC